MTRRLRFAALICNSSQLLDGLQLGRFRYERWGWRRFLPQLEALTGLPDHELRGQLEAEYFCTDQSDEHVYVASVDVDDPDIAPVGWPGSPFGCPSWKLHHEIQAELDQVCAALRFVSGMPVQSAMDFFWPVESPQEMVASRTARTRPQAPIPFWVESDTLATLSDAVGCYPTAPDGSYLAVALRAFESSFAPPEPGMALIHLIVALEALLNPGRAELRYRVSRNTAVLVGSTEGDADEIFRLVRSAYDARSRMLHTGDTAELVWSDIIRLRSIVSGSIVAAKTSGLPKDQLSSALNKLGFGQPLGSYAAEQ